MIRTIVYYGNNFQWKINVANRTALPCSLPCSLPPAPCPAACPAELCNFFMGFLPSAASCFFLFLMFFFRLPGGHLPGGRLPGGRLPGWVVGAYRFLKKRGVTFLPPKIPAIFSKKQPSPSTFNTALTHI